MEDAVSGNSFDSAADEFVVVNVEPRLQIAGNGGAHELEQKLTEIIADDLSPAAVKMADISSTEQVTEADKSAEVEQPLGSGDISGDAQLKNNTSTNSFNNLNVTSSTGQTNTSNSHVNSGIMTASCVSLEGDATVFTGITYLGSAAVDAPRSETEINRNMAVLNSQSRMAIPVTLSIPGHSEGSVCLLDPTLNTEIASYPIHHILFCARGPVDSEERRCFAFTCSHGDKPETAIFQCHVFSCDVNEAYVAKLLYCFATAFRRVPKSPSLLSDTSLISEDNVFRFHVALEFKELDTKGNPVTCPKDKNIFKLRCNVDKMIAITVLQLSHVRELKIERCFGLLISPGRNVKDGDMHVIDLASMGQATDSRSYLISAKWDPTDPAFEVLNTETPKDSHVFLTIAVDLVVAGIQEPVRFLIETRAKIFPANERFWYFTTKPHIEQFVLKLKECEDMSASMHKSQRPAQLLQHYEVISIESQTEIERKKSNMSLVGLQTGGRMDTSLEALSPQDTEDAEESDNDEPLLSGSGVVSKDVTDGNVLESWRDVLRSWHQNLRRRPRQVHSLVRKGIPEALRGEVWQLLAGCTDDMELLEAYRTLIMKDSASEQVILRDISRTFTAHEFFREAGGAGQESLFKISKAYSLYDEETGYCQGLSFLAAALLLHMPEEQAFCVLVSIMHNYGLRDLFRQGFEELHLKFFQLEKLMQDQLPDLFDHFMDLELAAHMYASQWFLTLFTAKFPLFMVFHIIDLFLSEGMETIFNVALGLLKASRRDLLALDFEGVLKYFRVQLPKKYKTEEAARELLQIATSMKVSVKRLKKLEKEFMMLKEQQEDPLERLQRENKRLTEMNLRLEQENDDLAHELVNSKIALRNDLDITEDRCDLLTKELLQTRARLLETEEEMKRLELETQQLKEVCRRELDRSQVENTRNQAITSDYKQICSHLSERLEKQQSAHREELGHIKKKVESCESCRQMFSQDGFFRKPPVSDDDEASAGDTSPELMEKERLLRDLELELAQTKLALVESECKNQDLLHQLNNALLELQPSKNSWFQKTLSSIKEVTNKAKDSTAGKEGGSVLSPSGSFIKDAVAGPKDVHNNRKE